ncbi:MAG TPA: hypothetical protein VHZ32_03085 [Rhizomicrobium sp.]|nr:hypothetical protein [Rhizomicrobium sp.]
MLSMPTLDALLLSGLFAAVGLWQLSGPAGLRRVYRRWRFPTNTHRVAGILAATVALFLSNPITRIWGVILGALVMFVAVTVLLNHRKYAWSVPGMLVMVALAPATLAGPLA